MKNVHLSYNRMYGTLADTKLLCCAAHGGSILDDIFAELYGALLNNTFHCSTLQTIPIGNSYAGREKFSTMTAKCDDYAFVGILCTCEPKSCNCLVKIKRVYAQHPNDDNYGINCVRLALEQGASPQVKVQCGTR